MENNSGGERAFVPNVLPWIVAAVALLVYAFTLNHWVSIINLPSVYRISGWNWEPEFLSPLYFLVTYPLRRLPVEWIPLALNLFSALCALLTLGQLARSVALLPHDRTHEQRLREHGDYFMLSGPFAWLPPALAAAACGLQLTFWEHGTNGSPEMFSLLVFAYLVRSLLEYRLDGRDARLHRAVFVYGAGMANDWALVGFFPAFVCTIGWIRGLSFFNFRFLTRTLFFGLAGLSLYLLLPCVAAGSGSQSLGFWLTLKTNLLAQKDLLVFFPRKTFVLFSLCSLVPVLLLSIRWASYFGDSSQLGTVTATWVFHIVHAGFLFACAWTIFDPPFSPRQRGMELGFPYSSLTYLSLYYLAALSIGYYSGYFLVVFRNAFSRGRRVVPVKSVANTLAYAMVIGLVIAVPGGLVWKNLPQIRITNGPLLKDFAATVAAELPASGVILSDDTRSLTLVRSWLVRIHKAESVLPIDTHAMPWPGYHRYLARAYPDKWRESTDPAREQIFSPGEIARQIVDLARTQELWYLQPSFGYYFEYFYAQPHGLAYQLQRYATNTVLPPRLDSEFVNSNERFWAGVIREQLPPLLAALNSQTPQNPPTARQKLMKTFRLPLDPNLTAVFLARSYSRALDYWGTQAQALNMLDRAGTYFDLALQTKPDNVVAQINLEANQKLRAGQTPAVAMSRPLENQFEKYRSWEQILNENGPYDEPNFCYAEGYTFLRDRLYRQAAGEFDRVNALLPDDVTSRILLAQIYLVAGLPDGVLAITHELDSQPRRFDLTGTNVVDLADLEAAAQFRLQKTNSAIATLERAADSNTITPVGLGKIALIYWQNGFYQNALKTLDRQLAAVPGDVDVLINKGYVYSLMNDYPHMILELNEALKTDPDNAPALLNRAIAFLHENRLDEAGADYTRLQQLFPNAHQAWYGLGEIAWRRHDTNAAISDYRALLTNTIPSGELRLATNRLNQLGGFKKP